MICRLTGAAGLILLFAGSAHDQVIPGDSPKNSLGDAVAHSTSRPVFGISSARVPKANKKRQSFALDQDSTVLLPYLVLHGGH
jgi:hypothetical protein